MRLLYILFLSACFAIIGYTCFWQGSTNGPDNTALAFIAAIKSGDLNKTVSFFDDVTCACPPAGGYVSYLRYESAQEPNLAFLLGQNFQIGKTIRIPLKEKFQYTLPWEHRETTALLFPITFAHNQGPNFLPLPMAFGKSMSESELEKFLDNLQIDHAQGLTLRLRPSLGTGLIKSASLPGRSNEKAGTATKSIPQIQYVTPKDPGTVFTASGKPLTAHELQSRLPRLQSIILKLVVGRRGYTHTWRIARFNFFNAVVQVDNHQSIRLSYTFAHK